MHRTFRLWLGVHIAFGALLFSVASVPAFAQSSFGMLEQMNFSTSSSNGNVGQGLNPNDPNGILQPLQPGDPDRVEEASCCLPETYGSVCAQGPFVKDGRADENTCLYNNANYDLSRQPGSADPDDPSENPIDFQDPESGIMPAPDGHDEAGVAYDTSQEQCSYFCNLRHNYYYCINRGRNPNDAPSCVTKGAEDDDGNALITPLVLQYERGYLLMPDDPNDPNSHDPGYDRCIETCPADTCDSCDELTRLMGPDELDFDEDDDAGRIQFCDQAHNSCEAALSDPNDENSPYICVQKPKCNLQYRACCDAQTSNLLLTNNDPEATGGDGTPEEVSQFMTPLDEDGTDNPDYIDNLEWMPGLGGAAVDDCLDARGIGHDEAGIYLDATDPILNPETGLQEVDPDTGQPLFQSALAVMADQCKPRYTACCDYLDFMDDEHENGGSYGFYVSELNNSPYIPSRLQTLIDNHGYAAYVPYQDDDDDPTNDIQACLGLEQGVLGDDQNGDQAEQGFFAAVWNQQERRILNDDDYQGLQDFANSCQYTYYGSSSSSSSEPRSCFACPFFTTEAECITASEPTPRYCQWVPFDTGHGMENRCVMNNRPIDQGGHPACVDMNIECKACYDVHDQTQCTTGMNNYCVWSTIPRDDGTSYGQCTPNPAPAPTGCGPQPPQAINYSACNRTVNRNPTTDKQCFLYDRALTLNIPIPSGAQVSKTQLLKTHTIVYDTTPPGQNFCSNMCTDIDLFAYCCHKPTGDLLFENIDVCRDNRDVTYPVDDSGLVREPPIPFAPVRDQCDALHANFLRNPPPPAGIDAGV